MHFIQAKWTVESSEPVLCESGSWIIRTHRLGAKMYHSWEEVATKKIHRTLEKAGLAGYQPAGAEH